MLFVNIAKERKLICSKRKKVWVDPGQVVDVDSVDMKFLGADRASLMEKAKYDELVTSRKKRRRKRKLRRRAKITAAAAKTKPAKKVSKIKKVVSKIKKAVKKKITKAPTAAVLKAQRVKLKDILTEKTKGDLLDFGDVVGLELKSKDKKATLITKILNAAKKAGYAKIIKKA